MYIRALHGAVICSEFCGTRYHTAFAVQCSAVQCMRMSCGAVQLRFIDPLVQCGCSCHLYKSLQCSVVAVFYFCSTVRVFNADNDITQ